MTTLFLAASLIRVFEGLKLTAYQDTGGKLTIGYGHTGPDVTPGLTITFAQAEALFEKDAAPLLAAVKDRGLYEAAALVSFGYNCGAGALQRLLAGEISLANYGRTDRKGNLLPGLAARRDLEAALIASAK